MKRLACLASILWLSGPASAASYVVTELSVPDGYSIVSAATSNAGVVVSSGQTNAGAWRAIVWVDGVPAVVEAAGTVGATFLWDVNNQGTAVGSTPTGTTGPRAATFDTGAGTWDVFSTGAGNSSGRSINDAGATTGFDSSGGWFAAPDGEITRIDPLPGDAFTFAFAINGFDEVVGWSAPDGLLRSAMMWSPAGGSAALQAWNPNDLSVYSVPSAIADSGVSVGGSLTAVSSTVALRWEPNGALQELAPLDGDVGGWATDINDSDVVVGYSTSGQGAATPVMWSAVGAVTDLSENLPGSFDASGYAMAIADNGTIVVARSDFRALAVITPAQAGAPGQQGENPVDSGSLPDQAEVPEGAGPPDHANGKGRRGPR